MVLKLTKKRSHYSSKLSTIIVFAIIELHLRLREVTAPRDHDEGLYTPASKSDAAAALIFLLLDSNSICLLVDMEDPDDLGKIGAALINARLSFVFLSNLKENFTWAALAASSSDAGSSRMPRPLFLETASSSATLFF